MADEYRQLKVSADQIDNAVNWVEANKDEIEQDFLVVENCFDRIAAAEERLDENEETVKWVEENKETIEQDFVVLDNCFDRIAAAEVKISKLESEQVEVDSDFSDTSENPVQNKVITEQFSHYYTTAETDEKITEKVSEIVAGAPDDFNTLKEMSDWLTEHEDSAATMNSAIQKNAEDIATANENIEKNETDIATANENIQKNVDDITALKNDVAINRTTLGTQYKNLLKPFNSETRAGITYTVNDDGSVVLSGSNTSSSYNYYSIPIILKAGTYKVSGMPSTSSNSSYRVDLRAEATGGTVYGYGTKEFEVTFDETVTAYYMIRIDAAYKESLDGIVFYPMIRYAEITDDTYEPYMPSLQEQINTLLSVKTYNQTCFTKDSTQTDLIIRNDTYIKENAFAWSFNPHITFIAKIPANTKTIIGTVSPPPPRRIIQKSVTIHDNENRTAITTNATIEITTSGEIYITSPVAICEDGTTGVYGRININSCFLEVLKFDLAATATTTEGGE